MSVEKITQIEDVFPLDKTSKILEHKISRLTAPGENYGSLMLNVAITVETPSGTEEIQTVAKMIPPNDFIQKMFNTQTTFKNEIAFYKNMVPAFEQFQKEQGMDKPIDFVPKYYGSRINLNGDEDKVDSDAILLIENLKLAGFINLDRTVGFDLEAAKLVIADLAHLHAVSLALKCKKPEVFAKEVKRYLAPLPQAGMDKFLTELLNKIMDIEEIKMYRPNIEKMNKQYTPPLPREPFATFCHKDCWVNNTMIKMDGNSPVKNKLIDFQICDYCSPACDLLFFLFSSVKNHVLEENYDFLVKYYHDVFISILEQLKCDTTQFGYEAFLQEMDLEATTREWIHILIMTFPIFAPKGTIQDVADMNADNFIIKDQLTDAQREKLIFVVKQFAKRNWI